MDVADIVTVLNHPEVDLVLKLLLAFGICIFILLFWIGFNLVFINHKLKHIEKVEIM